MISLYTIGTLGGIAMAARAALSSHWLGLALWIPIAVGNGLSLRSWLSRKPGRTGQAPG